MRQARAPFSLDESIDVATEEVKMESRRFNGKIAFVQIDIGKEDKERFRAAMARQ